MSVSSRQHSIDLMPESIRARSQAGVRMGQFIAFAIVSMTLAIAAATHSRLALSSAQDRLFETAARAEEVFSTEARAAQLRHELDGIQGFTRLYERLALPLNVGDVLATVVNVLPESVSLDQVDLDAGVRVLGRTARSRGTGADQLNDAPPRALTGEISGFAATDQQIAELVTRLASIAPFEDVSLDFSRSRRVHDKDAREFRVSFRINLDAGYRVTHADSDDAGTADASPKEVADANH
jgi:hypothetical protein